LAIGEGDARVGAGRARPVAVCLVELRVLDKACNATYIQTLKIKKGVGLMAKLGIPLPKFVATYFSSKFKFPVEHLLGVWTVEPSSGGGPILIDQVNFMVGIAAGSKDPVSTVFPETWSVVLFDLTAGVTDAGGSSVLKSGPSFDAAVSYLNRTRFSWTSHRLMVG